LHPKIYELLDKGDRIGTFECIYIQIRSVLYVKKNICIDINVY